MPDTFIPPEIRNDEFSRLIEVLAGQPDVSTMLEIGSSSGEGSTVSFIKGMRRHAGKCDLYCVELIRARFEKLKERYQFQPNVHCYNVSTVPVEKLPTADEVAAFYHSHPTNLNHCSLEQVLGWLKEGVDYIQSSGVETCGIEWIKRENGLDHFDLVLIDGSPFTGTAELEAVYGASYILLDDINDIKNFESHQRLSNDPAYKLIARNLTLRNGYSAFCKVPLDPNLDGLKPTFWESIAGFLHKSKKRRK